MPTVVPAMLSKACHHDSAGGVENLAGGPPSMPVQVAAVCMLIFFFFVTDQCTLSVKKSGIKEVSHSTP